MSVLDALASCAGAWRGNTKLQDPINQIADESATMAKITRVLKGNFVRLDYTWDYKGDPQEGSFLFGYMPSSGEVTAYWADTWHMGHMVMECRGQAVGDHSLSVFGTYAAPPGPDWGWRTTLTVDGDTLRMEMYNVWPEGKEELAVRSSWSRRL